MRESTEKFQNSLATFKFQGLHMQTEDLISRRIQTFVVLEHCIEYNGH